MNEFEYIGEWVEVKCANDGSKFIVDRSCWDSYLKDYKWISCTNKYGQISIQTAVNKVTKLIHQMIYEREYPKWMWHGAIIDHISDSYYGNKRRDNRKCNLRICTQTDNTKNKSLYKNNKSGHSGVYYNKRDKIWCAYINCKNKGYYLGQYKTKEEAIEIREKYEKEFFGEFAPTNN